MDVAEGTKPCPFRLDSHYVKPKQGTESKSDLALTSKWAARFLQSQSRLKRILGEPNEVRMNIVTVLCCSGDKTNILGFLKIGLLCSLVFCISTGKNPGLALMSFALEWRKDHR